MIRALVCALLLPAWAAAQDRPLTVGVYAPQVHFQNSLARGQYAQAVAQALAAKTGLDVRGRAFGGSGEFGEQAKAGAVDFGIVDAQFAREQGYRPIAQGVREGQTAAPMVLVVGDGVSGTTIGDLQGKRLARVAVGGSDAKFVSNFLLRGQVDPAYFKKGATARDVQGALSLVKLGKADATFAYAAAAGGMRVVYRTRPVPLPYFVQTNAAVPDEAAAKIKAAIGGVAVANPLFGGFGPPGADGAFAKALSGGLSRPSGTPILASVKSNLPPVPAFLDAGDAAPELPPPTLDLPVPSPPGDLL